MELKALTKAIIKELKHPLVLFIGELGAGKTTLIKEMISALGSDDDGSSPSYALINQYQSKDAPIYHIDLYRLESKEDVFHLGIEEILYSGHYCFVEWPQIIADYIEKPYHVIKIELEENNNRIITLV